MKTKSQVLLYENPFSRFVSRSEIPDLIDIREPRKDAEAVIIRSLDEVRSTKVPKILPILGDAGYGKTHLFWTIQKRFKRTHTVYVTPPSSPDRIFSHFYFSFVKTAGEKVVYQIAEKLRKKHQTFDNALFESPGSGNIVLEAFFAVGNPKYARLAKRWLTGVRVDNEILTERTILEDEELAFEALKIVLENSEFPVIFFVDELEGFFLSEGKPAGVKFLEALKRLYNEAPNHLIVLACLTEMWEQIHTLSSPSIQSRIERPSLLRRFQIKDLSQFSYLVLQGFWKKHNLTSTMEDLWPLTSEDIQKAYKWSRGNPREAIKALKRHLEERKLEMLDSLAETNRMLASQVSKAKKVLNMVRSQVGGLSLGVFSRGFGAFLVLSQGEARRVAIAVPPTEKYPQLRETFSEYITELQHQSGFTDVVVLDNRVHKDNGILWLDVNDEISTARDIVHLFIDEERNS